MVEQTMIDVSKSKSLNRYVYSNISRYEINIANTFFPCRVWNLWIPNVKYIDNFHHLIPQLDLHTYTQLQNLATEEIQNSKMFMELCALCAIEYIAKLAGQWQEISLCS